MDRERQREYQKRWRENNPEYKRRWAEAHPGYFERKAKNNQSRAQAQAKVLGEITKEFILKHYGNGKLACVRCGFSDIRALSLDHIDGGGNKIRNAQKLAHKRVLSGKALYRVLFLSGCPEGFQTLCMNCQFIKRYENNENTVDSGLI